MRHHRDKLRRHRFMLLAGSAALALGGPALAQSDAAGVQTEQGAGTVAGAPQSNDPTTAQVQPATADPGEILVTARRREESLNHVPVAVTAFSAADLQKREIITTGDLVKVTPGLNISQSGNFVPYLTIRAQTRGLTGPGTPGVLTYFNEVPLPNTGSLISTFDMSNIQVLKGPQGTLFGRNASGGAVLTYSKVPVYDFEGYAEAEYAEFDTYRARGAINVPIVKDVLAFRVAGEYTKTDGYTHTTRYAPYSQTAAGVETPGALLPTTRNYDQVTTKGVRASLLFQPTSNLRNTTVVDYIHYRGANNSYLSAIFPGGTPLPDGTRASPALIFLPTSVLVASLGPTLAGNIDRLFRCTTGPNCNIIQYAALAQQLGKRNVATDLNPDARNTLFGVSNTTTLEIADALTIKNIFGYRHTKTFHNPDVDGTPFTISETASRSDVEQYTDELQASGKLLDDKLSYVAGLFYYKTVPSKLYGFSSLNVNSFAGISQNSTFNYLSERSRAAYAQVDYSLSSLLEGLGLTAGYRYTWDKASGCAAGITYSPFGGEVPGQLVNQITKEQCEDKAIPVFASSTRRVADNFSKKSSEGTYTLGINWQINPQTLLYAVTRRGYRAAGYNTPTFPAQYAAIQTFDPETITDVEVGLKSSFSLGGVRANFTGDIFRGKDKGYQVFQVFSGIALQTITSGALLNEANLTIQGVEAGLTLNLFEGFTLGGDFAYTDVNVDKVTLDPTVAAAYTAAGRTQPSIVISQQTKWQQNARFDYSVPGDLAGGTLSFGADVHHQTSYASTDYRVPGYTVVNAKITLANVLGNPVDISVYARNLLDKTYFSGPATGSGGLGIFSYLVAPPRQIGASVRVRFGG